MRASACRGLHLLFHQGVESRLHALARLFGEFLHSLLDFIEFSFALRKQHVALAELTFERLCASRHEDVRLDRGAARVPVCSSVFRVKEHGRLDRGAARVPMCLRMFFISGFDVVGVLLGACSDSAWTNFPFSSRGISREIGASVLLVSEPDMHEGHLNTCYAI